MINLLTNELFTKVVAKSKKLVIIIKGNLPISNVINKSDKIPNEMFDKTNAVKIKP